MISSQKKLKILFCFAFQVVCIFSLYAEITLPSVFGSNMVLQQKSNVAIWGKGEPQSIVEVVTSWDNVRYNVKSDSQGDWRVEVKTPVAGGPYVISISDGIKMTLKNIMIGEVWFCSGQSNMEMLMKGGPNQPVDGSNYTIAKSGNQEIRLFTVSRSKSLTPLNDLEGKWKECIPGNVANFSATAYYFGKMLQETLKVPVGLMCSAWGGTRIEPWISPDGIRQFDFLSIPELKQGDNYSYQYPSVLFNAMVSPFVGYGIRGVIWYQGEANRKEPERYSKLLPGLIENWREKWGIGDFYFFYAQIAPFRYWWDENTNSAYLREAQLSVSTLLPNIGMACLLDVGEKYEIHPKNKKIVGERLAYQALANTYGMKGIAFSGPVLKEMQVKGSVVELTFDHAENGLTSFGKELSLFKLAGDDKHFYPAKAEITPKGIVLSSPRVTEPVAVRYAFDDFVVGELYNTEGLPASSFRTDDW